MLICRSLAQGPAPRSSVPVHLCSIPPALGRKAETIRNTKSRARKRKALKSRLLLFFWVVLVYSAFCLPYSMIQSKCVRFTLVSEGRGLLVGHRFDHSAEQLGLIMEAASVRMCDIIPTCHAMRYCYLAPKLDMANDTLICHARARVLAPPRPVFLLTATPSPSPLTGTTLHRTGAHTLSLTHSHSVQAQLCNVDRFTTRCHTTMWTLQGTHARLSCR